jgi:DGQHR domain-containing protein
VDTIHKSAKYELLKYLDVKLSQVGEMRVRGSGVSSDGFPAFAMPISHTNYPPEFAIVSFYADPLSLIERAYVMRRDGWEEPDLSYQRFVKSDKLLSMREYLSTDGTVFITNLIVTLPSTSVLKDAKGGVVDPKKLTKKSIVMLELPLELGTVGIVDGQHRIFSYYEGSDTTDATIDALRKRQNLLVTGIIFPPSYTPEMRVKFEASIFLGINNNQSAVNPQLRQDLEMIISPATPLAMARAVVIRLSKEGPLGGLLQMSQFDPSDKIATGSLAPYVLKTLMGPRGALYKQWDANGERDLTDNADRKAYIDFTVAHLKRLLVGASQNIKDRWKTVAQGGILSTTAVGGLLMSLDGFAKESKFNTIDFKTRLRAFATFDFASYTSGSNWRKLATDLYAAT